MSEKSLPDFVRSLTCRLSLTLVLCLVFSWANAATTLVDFPIGYSSNGGTYGFISLVQQQHLLEQQGIRPQFIYIGGIQITQAFVAGDILMEIGRAPSPIRACGHGSGLRVGGGGMDREGLTVITHPSV